MQWNKHVDLATPKDTCSNHLVPRTPIDGAYIVAI